ncbi:hypothetical protein CFOL_v3_04777 [Cephalotus follicularis]|uniref:peroxidase n=1 Tax=Cephalotus follicularis TaxID=3775 RepID=A0A1Q3AZV0_CEPFO|nr:hypothetical protein CFOL_v3_04777 [Cephalotus follicularis]
MYWILLQAKKQDKAKEVFVASTPLNKTVGYIHIDVLILLRERERERERERMGCWFVKVVLAAALVMRVCEAQLGFGYYESSCPNVENIVRQELLTIFLTDPTAPAAFLRLLFHDCQVQVSPYLSSNRVRIH